MKPARPENAEFSERLRQAREHAGYVGVREAARALRVNENTYKSRENGNRGIPEYSDVRVYAKAFKVDFVWLLTGEGQIPDWYVGNSQSHVGQVSEAIVDEDRPLYTGQLKDSDRIQVEVGELRTTALHMLARSKKTKSGPDTLVDVLISTLADQPSASAVVRLAEYGHNPPGSQGPGRGDRS